METAQQLQIRCVARLTSQYPRQQIFPSIVTMPTTRQHLLNFIAFATLQTVSGLSHAAAPVVEIIALSHPPVASALKPLRDWLGAQGNKVKLIEIDMESAEGQKRLTAAGVKGHTPILILINGQYKLNRTDGSTVELLSFPAGPTTPTGVKGGWSADDIKALLKPGKL
jgi:hypothetical protein